MNNLLICIVLFRPSKKELEIIKEYRNYGYDILIYDNSFNNKGLSYRYNQALDYAQKNNKQWILLLDQDSYIDKNSFIKYIKCINNFKSNNIAIFSINTKHKDTIDCIYQLNKIHISSGSIINVEIALKIGSFDDNLFIDEVDHEFALKAIVNGYKTVFFKKIYIKHKLGYKENLYQISYNCYRSERYYYMIRNFLYISKKFKKINNKAIINFLKKRRRYLVKFFLKSLLLCKNRIEIFKKLMKGWYDYKKNNLGKQVLIE
jgi:rhamnosyltransferase